MLSATGADPWSLNPSTSSCRIIPEDLVPGESKEKLDSRKLGQERKTVHFLLVSCNGFQHLSLLQEEGPQWPTLLREIPSAPFDKHTRSGVSAPVHGFPCLLITISSRRIMSYKMSKTRSSTLEECHLEIKPCFYWIADLLKAVIWNICRSLGSVNNCYLHISNSLQFLLLHSSACL